MTPAEQFLIWRRRHGLSQYAAARQLGISRPQVQLIERGEVSPRRYLTPEQLPEILSPGEEMLLMRRRHGLTIYQASAILDCSLDTLCALEHDRKTIEYSDLKHVEQAYRSGYRTSL